MSLAWSIGKASISARSPIDGPWPVLRTPTPPVLPMYLTTELGRAMLLEAKLGVGVQVLPPGGHVIVKCLDEILNLHGDRSQLL
jgi:hypothetical protein